MRMIGWSDGVIKVCTTKGLSWRCCFTYCDYIYKTIFVCVLLDRLLKLLLKLMKLFMYMFIYLKQTKSHSIYVVCKLFKKFVNMSRSHWLFVTKAHASTLLKISFAENILYTMYWYWKIRRMFKLVGLRVTYNLAINKAVNFIEMDDIC